MLRSHLERMPGALYYAYVAAACPISSVRSAWRCSPRSMARCRRRLALCYGSQDEASSWLLTLSRTAPIHVHQTIRETEKEIALAPLPGNVQPRLRIWQELSLRCSRQRPAFYRCVSQFKGLGQNSSLLELVRKLNKVHWD